MAMAFGPLSADGGERRLNVLISRAKRRCEVYASITDEDIDLERGKGKGVFAFKLFLQFARTGRLSMAEASGRDHDSVFEIQVANALVERGYQVHPQVGIAGFFIDLAIADPERPGRYVLGIECDGAAYHNARSARDRDRLRQSVLEEHGWILHRIWSTDWFQRPKEQLERTVAAIEAAKAELEARGERTPNSTAVSIVPVGMVTIDRDDANEIEGVDGKDAQSGSAYVEASPERPRGWPELHETSAGLLSQMVAEVAATEGPVHVDEVVARIRSAWDLQRSGGRIQAAVEQAITLATQSSRVKLEGGFLSVPGGIVRVRDRSGVISSNLRKPEMLPPAEMKAGVLRVVRANLGGSQDQVIGSVLRLLGFRSSSAQLRHVVQLAINDLIEEGFLERQGEYLVATEVEAER
jgi:very-short-patch-repair endonuclease